MTTYFENLTVELPEFKHLIDYIAIDILQARKIEEENVF